MNFWKCVLALWMCGVTYAALTAPPIKGLFACPVVYFHPPVAIVSFAAFLVAMVYGVWYLRGRDPSDDLKSATAAQIGLLFCFLATVTGALWSRVNWGSWWVWETKQTSVFLLLLIYAAYFALRSSTIGSEQQGALCAVYSIVGCISAVLLMFVLPRLPRVGSVLHPSAPFFDKGTHPYFTCLFLASFLGFLGVFVWMFQLVVRLTQLESGEDFA